jgi:hypothetical protein
MDLDRGDEPGSWNKEDGGFGGSHACFTGCREGTGACLYRQCQPEPYMLRMVTSS